MAIEKEVLENIRANGSINLNKWVNAYTALSEHYKNRRLSRTPYWCSSFKPYEELKILSRRELFRNKKIVEELWQEVLEDLDKFNVTINLGDYCPIV